MRCLCLAVLFALMVQLAYAIPPHHATELYCHRTANQDVPENTLESLEYAALVGCNVVEIDLRRTLDGVLVLNHDGVLERLTDGEGTVEDKTLSELQLLDAGAWMSPRFAGMRIPRFIDALRLARSLNIRLMLDIKDKGIGSEVARLVKEESMADRVQFGGEWQEVKAIIPAAVDPDSEDTWVEPGITADRIALLRGQGKTVIANFSANGHEMDLTGMKASVAAGVDAIFVDFPRLGADAVGRPVEAAIGHLIVEASQGTDSDRSAAVRSLARYQDPDLQQQFLNWLDSPQPLTSHAAALALLTSRPRVESVQLQPALHSENPVARANAVWLLGMLHGNAADFGALLSDRDENVRVQALLALSRAVGTWPRKKIVAFLTSELVAERGAAALALAHLHPNGAASVILAGLRTEISSEEGIAKAYVAGGRKEISRNQADSVMRSFRVQMQMIHALAGLDIRESTQALTYLALHPTHEFAQTDGLLAGFQLWDRVGNDPAPILQALSSKEPGVADRAEWALVKGDRRVLPPLRAILGKPGPHDRAIRILAWHGDVAALSSLDAIAHSDDPDRDLASWAAEKIRLLAAVDR
jgi:glycerophosphoryl diester phosphodiesterase/HEAT repeat protein